jgi:hypothetical protein
MVPNQTPLHHLVPRGSVTPSSHQVLRVVGVTGWTKGLVMVLNQTPLHHLVPRGLVTPSSQPSIGSFKVRVREVTPDTPRSFPLAVFMHQVLVRSRFETGG